MISQCWDLKWISRFTSHYSISNQLSNTVAFDGCLIYHSFYCLSSRIIKIFQTFLKFDQHRTFQQLPEKWRFFNISHFKAFVKSFFQLFSKFFINLTTFNWTVEVSHQWRFPNIHPEFSKFKLNFKDFFKFCLIQTLNGVQLQLEFIPGSLFK